MNAYRLAKPVYAQDLSGTGARLYGGRWNPAGVPCLYSSENRALAALEVLVHADEHTLKLPFKLITLNISEEHLIYKPALDELPSVWANYPFTQETQFFGQHLLNAQHYLGFYVPSVVMPYEYNLILNVLHPAFSASVCITEIVDWRLDGRLVAVGTE